jgi:excisionase family DNA binding protein
VRERKKGDPYTVREAAEALRVGEVSVYSACRTGELPCMRFEGREGAAGTIRIAEADFDAWVAKSKTVPDRLGTDEIELKYIKMKKG